MKLLQILLTLLLAAPVAAQSLALDVYNGSTFSQVDVATGANSLLGFNGSGVPALITAGTGISIAGNVITASGTGTVSSVSGSGGTTGLTLTGGPITASGTLTLGGTLALANGGTGATTAANARTALGLVIGTNVQAYSAMLAGVAGLTYAGPFSGGFRIDGGSFNMVKGADASEESYSASGGSGGNIGTYGGNAWASSVQAWPGGDGGTLVMGGGTGSIDGPGGNAGQISTSAAFIYSGGSLFLNSDGSKAAGSIYTQGGGSLTMGSGNLSGGDTSGTILTTAGDGSALTGLTASQITTGTLGLANGGTGATTAATARTALGLVIGTDVQAYSATTSLLGSSIDLASEITGTLALANGGTGATTAATARTALGLVIGTDVQAFGAVTSVTGTANQITVTGTTTPVLSLPSAVSGPTSVQLGAIGTVGQLIAPSTSSLGLQLRAYNGIDFFNTQYGYSMGSVNGGSWNIANVNCAAGAKSSRMDTNYGLQCASAATVGWTSASNVALAPDTTLSRVSAGQLQMGGNAGTGTPVAQTFKGPDGTAGQTNQPGGTLTLSSGRSTGSGAASVILATSANTAASTTLNAVVTRLTANASGITIGARGSPISALATVVKSAFNPASIAAGATETTTATITGAVAGSAYLPTPIYWAGLVISADRTGTDTVTITLYNPTAAAIDAAATDIRITEIAF